MADVRGVKASFTGRCPLRGGVVSIPSICSGEHRTVLCAVDQSPRLLSLRLTHHHTDWPISWTALSWRSIRWGMGPKMPGVSTLLPKGTRSKCCCVQMSPALDTDWDTDQCTAPVRGLR
jgi:hypothetical protein